MRPFFFLLLFTLNYAEAKPYIIFSNAPHGFFSIFQMALSLCEAYENGVIQGAHVDFKKEGFYFDAFHGENWWEYYFKPLKFGNSQGAQIYELPRIKCFHIELYNSREQNYQLIKKYIGIKPHIQAKVDAFVSRNFRDKYVIGVHYRGTDKTDSSVKQGDVPRISYEEVARRVECEVPENKEWVIFLATDEQQMVSYLEKKFPKKVCTLPTVLRSHNGKATHYKKGWLHGEMTLLPHKHPYKNGEDALIDCLLLSKTDILVRTSSNLSFISSCINPHLRQVLLSERHTEDNGLPPRITHEMIEMCKDKKNPSIYFEL